MVREEQRRRNGNGQSQSPFNTLAACQHAPRHAGTGDIIYVYNGDGNTTNQSRRHHAARTTQQLIGEGVALVVNTVTLVPAGTKPQITNRRTGDVVTLADGNTVKGLISSTGATRDGITGTHARPASPATR